MNVLLRAHLVFSSSIVLPEMFCPFKPTILVTSTLVHLLEHITATITTTAIIAPVIIAIICLNFCFKIVYNITNLILSHFYKFRNTANSYLIPNTRWEHR